MCHLTSPGIALFVATEAAVYRLRLWPEFFFFNRALGSALSLRSSTFVAFRFTHTQGLSLLCVFRLPSQKMRMRVEREVRTSEGLASNVLEHRWEGGGYIVLLVARAVLKRQEDRREEKC